MSINNILAGGILVGCIFTSAAAQDTAPAPAKIDPIAKALIEKMGSFYKGLEGAQFTGTLKVESEEFPFPMEQSSTVKVRRPNLFLAESGDSMMGGIDAASDGKSMMIAMPMFKLYQELPAPKNFDELVPGFDEEEMPDSASMVLSQDPGLTIALMLFGSDPAERLLEHVTSLSIIGTEQFEGVEATRLKVESTEDSMSPNTNAEFWIANGEKPWLLGLRPDLDAMMAEMPDQNPEMNMTLSFVDWEQRVPDGKTFEIAPEEDWTKVDDLMEAVMSQAAEQMGDFEMPADAPFEPQAHPTIDTPAPAFSLKTLRTDETVSLESLAGKVVVLDFWATWCAPCVAGLPSVDKVTSKFKDRGVAFYAIDLREPAKRVQSFVDKKKWTFPVLLDEKGEVARSYGVGGIPHSLVIGKDGKITSVVVGFTGAAALEKQLTEELEAALEAHPSTG